MKFESQVLGLSVEGYEGSVYTAAKKQTDAVFGSTRNTDCNGNGALGKSFRVLISAGPIHGSFGAMGFNK